MVKNEKALVIDPGPASNILVLRSALDSLKIQSIEYILLTHIHPDHAVRI